MDYFGGKGQFKSKELIGPEGSGRKVGIGLILVE
jgi:hypothetical protein